MTTNAHLGKIQRLVGDIADRYPDAHTHNVTQDLIAHATALAAELDAERARVARFERIAALHPTILAMRVEPSGWMVTFDREWDSSKAVDAISRTSLIDAIEAAHGDLPDEEATRA